MEERQRKPQGSQAKTILKDSGGGGRGGYYRQRETEEKHKDQKKENRREDERKQVTETGKELGGRRERERRGRRTEKKAKGQRNNEAVRIRVGSEPPRPRPRPRPLTGPAWGCPRFHTSHTHGSADTRDSSGSGHSSGTEAPSVRCGEAGVRPPELPPPRPTSTLPFRAPAARPHLSSQPRQPPCGYRAR